MASKKREKIKLKSSESDFHYYTVKNKSNTSGRLEIKNGQLTKTRKFQRDEVILSNLGG